MNDETKRNGPRIAHRDTPTERQIAIAIPHEWADQQLSEGRTTIYIHDDRAEALTNDERAAMLAGSPFTRPMSPHIRE